MFTKVKPHGSGGNPLGYRLYIGSLTLVRTEINKEEFGSAGRETICSSPYTLHAPLRLSPTIAFTLSFSRSLLGKYAALAGISSSFFTFPFSNLNYYSILGSCVTMYLSVLSRIPYRLISTPLKCGTPCFPYWLTYKPQYSPPDH